MTLNHRFFVRKEDNCIIDRLNPAAKYLVPPAGKMRRKMTCTCANKCFGAVLTIWLVS